ncbi:hypothetical protein [Vibrio algivorus]|uniref:Porin family protein n=1 Tax=Vibrio algivorus TaxID=1667024 RepID=A0A557NZ91_9VIBR|nr:hypothetical protein [Vibrio algivorus]TVO33731.1 hypothetical protein FOF44_14550 [Vibrio algivorus]
MKKQIRSKALLSVIVLALLSISTASHADMTSPIQSKAESIGPKENTEQERLFPIWGKEARERGYTLPKTYGFSLSYMSMDQPIKINNINLSGPISVAPNQDLSTVSDALFDNYLDISDATQQANNVTLRGDMWLFPFLNVYGLLGYTDGTSSAPISCKAGRPTTIRGNPLASIVNQLCGQNPDETRHIGNFNLDYHGVTYGIGTTLAGGVGNWFTIVDVNFSRTELDILDGQINSVVVSPRVGYRFTPYNHELRVWVGAMYQGIQQEMAGDLSDILSGDLATAVNAIAPDGRFDVKQELESEWNTTLGFNYVLSPTWDVIAEVGIGERSSAFIGLDYRY